MVAKLTRGFWAKIARIILRNRIIILVLLAIMTLFMSMQWEKMRFSNSQANLLPDHHPVNLEYLSFLEQFGEEGNVVVLAVKDSALFTPIKFNRWNKLSKQLGAFPEVDFVLSTDNLQELVKDTVKQEFVMQPFIKQTPKTKKEVDSLTNHLFNDLPFYDNLIYNKKTHTIRSVIYLDKDIVNTSVRKDFILEDLSTLVKNFEKETGLDVHISGMPYIRTMNSQNIIDEIGKFILAALGVTSLIFFFFFRSFRATIISMFVVIIGVMWAFGILGLLQYEITVLTALIPPLIIVIGIPNCIFLINKYQQEVKKHGNQALSLQRVISKIGNATLMTNVTTASGFATFIITDSKLLKEFGIVASINIIGIFVLSLLIIPIIYSFMSLPKDKHLKHLNTKWIETFVSWMERIVRERRISVYIVSIALLVASIIGIYQIDISGSPIEDMPKKAEFFQDIRFFEQEFDGIMPVEIVVDTERPKGVLKLSTLRKMDELGTVINEIPELSRPVSVVDLVKYSKQAFYSGIPKYYQLPTSQENTFIMDVARKSADNGNLLSSFVDSTGQVARITTYMKDVKTSRMETIEAKLKENIDKIFPADRYKVTMTGSALLFLKGTKYLVKNLIMSLALAIGLIALFMAYLFRSFRMIVISLIPNLLPLVITAGVMGFVGVPIKPSTILVFSIAFGISVDDTIHFLAKYRQELTSNHWRIKKSVYAALRETGVSMFYTSIVLFFGFSVFIISSFGGTVALGALVSATLLFAMLANLILLPSLLLSLERSIANKQVLKEPHIDILPKEELNIPDKE
ncbi:MULTISPECIES: efflux RND transporter permease subunit [Arenibacter]|jgi:predicted RND superfamily exporter protein|uniref:Aminoglycoside/multidrug efflux system n=1 Tax=Arenibacter algicola TaxID=616991 RepID=A0A221UX47_9FLAO|nr:MULTISPECIES: efflux RND transporter permease subunit [Arenibacter]ASO05676.1 aminoglycoside/multidrug efflux system [Arenibacter algicola]MDX1758458.1 MMPL family transporter [Arenibacter algicola]GBF20821.1 aminoglycoside/multidrug efflux system [Arenibacter sp. NBRC 103722]|tara:strand:+ start:42708 stop:45107 length:2400 start_codon:yes stop_codon:yes gene_type:complete